MNIYLAAASVVDQVRIKHIGIRTALYALPIHHGLRPSVQALAQESLKHADNIVAAAKAVGLMAKVQALDATFRVDAKRFHALPAFFPESLVLVLVYELLLGPRRRLKGAHSGAIELVRDAAPAIQTYIQTHFHDSSTALALVKSEKTFAFPRYFAQNHQRNSTASFNEISTTYHCQMGFNYHIYA
jgi:hypothetical protein